MALSLEKLRARNSQRRIPVSGSEAAAPPPRPWEDPSPELLARLNARLGSSHPVPSTEESRTTRAHGAAEAEPFATADGARALGASRVGSPVEVAATRPVRSQDDSRTSHVQVADVCLTLPSEVDYEGRLVSAEAQPVIEPAASAPSRGEQNGESRTTRVQMGVDAEVARETHERHREGARVVPAAKVGTGLLGPSLPDSRTSHVQRDASGFPALEGDGPIDAVSTASMSAPSPRGFEAVSAADLRTTRAPEFRDDLNDLTADTKPIEQAPGPLRDREALEWNAQVINDMRTSGVQQPQDSRTSRVRAVDESRTSHVQGGADSRTSRAHRTRDSRTTSAQVASAAPSSHTQAVDELRTTHTQHPRELNISRVQNHTEPRTTRAPTLTESRTTRVQNVDESRTSHAPQPEQPRTTHVPNDDETDVDLRTTLTSESRTTKTIPRAGAQRILLTYLLEQQMKAGAGRTPILSRAQISLDTHINKNSIDTTLRRLVSQELIRRNEISHAWNCGGASFTVSKFAANRLLLEAVDSRKNQAADLRTALTADSRTHSAQPPPVVSSSIQTTTTDETRKLVERLQQACDRFGLDDFSLGANDLMQAWRSQAFADPGDLVLSAEHLAFYLRSEAAKGIQQPKAWFVSTLKRGYYAPPPNFIPWEARQLQSKLDAARRRAATIAALRRETFDLEFNNWLIDTPAEEKRRILRPSPFLDDINSIGAKMLLREEFAKRTGNQDLLAS